MMTLPVVLRDQVAEELLVACDYLEARQAGLSVRLIAEVKRVVNRISAHPELHGLVLQDIRRAAVRRFSYSVFYRVLPTRIASSQCFTTRGIRLSGKAALDRSEFHTPRKSRSARKSKMWQGGSVK